MARQPARIEWIWQLADLVAKGCLVLLGSGRSARYELAEKVSMPRVAD
jgi:hypothetical protein